MCFRSLHKLHLIELYALLFYMFGRCESAKPTHKRTRTFVVRTQKYHICTQHALYTSQTEVRADIELITK